MFRAKNNQQATGDQHSDVKLGLMIVLLDVTFKIGLHMLLLTFIYLSILKIIASKFQEMLLRGSTLQT